MKAVWITRTDPQRSNQIPMGWRAVNIPLLKVAPSATLPTPPRANDVLVFTSGNAVRWFCQYTDKRHWPIYTVGDATAKLAKKAGFRTIKSAGKDVDALRNLITKNTKLKSQRLYYASGQDIAGDLEVDLARNGYQIERQVLYDTYPILHTPPPIDAILASKHPLTVLLYSPKGAKAFRALDLDFTRAETISISNNVDKCLAGLGLRTQKTADQPTHASLIKHLI